MRYRSLNAFIAVSCCFSLTTRTSFQYHLMSLTTSHYRLLSLTHSLTHSLTLIAIYHHSLTHSLAHSLIVVYSHSPPSLSIHIHPPYTCIPFSTLHNNLPSLFSLPLNPPHSPSITPLTTTTGTQTATARRLDHHARSYLAQQLLLQPQNRREHVRTLIFSYPNPNT